MTSNERLRRFYFHEEMDRPAVIFRWRGFRDDPSYADLFRLMQERADWVEPWDATFLVQAGAPPASSTPEERIERLLLSPLPEIGSDGPVSLACGSRWGTAASFWRHWGTIPAGTWPNSSARRRLP